MTSTDPNQAATPARPRVAAAGPGPRRERFQDELIRPFITFSAIAGTAVEWPSYHIIWPALALPLFILTSLSAMGTLFPLTRLTQRQQIILMAAYVVLGSLLLPLAHTTTAASLFPFVATAAAGGILESRRAAIAIAIAGGLVSAGATWLVEQLAPATSQWPWWIALTVALPVYIGISNRDRLVAVFNARQAAAQAQRAAESEARAAALEERGRIAREIHDVLGHSLSGIALQLDMADALRESGRVDEATVAIRKARALAVDSISETRSAVHALREDTLPLPETLHRMADDGAITFHVDGEPGPVAVDATHTIVRAAQEALTNAVKHAPGATRAMTLTFTPDTVRLTVTNGPATEPAPAAMAGGTGMGLVGMRERVALLDGTVHVGPDSAAGGWTVDVEVPR
ncbi:MAG TPA: histidine kinase [Pseudonocardiaceae bacterium]|nr:histidine kinase [Pseudonocardiaceae bacterium]